LVCKGTFCEAREFGLKTFCIYLLTRKINPVSLTTSNHFDVNIVVGDRIWPRNDDPSWQIDDRVAPQSGEIVLHKTTSGPVNSTKLDQLLHNLGVTSLVVVGLTTDVCVTQTARETADRGFRVVVAEDACTTLSEEMHKSALLAFSLAFGVCEKQRNW
jgi:nicotinamidase-related amidase